MKDTTPAFLLFVFPFCMFMELYSKMYRRQGTRFQNSRFYVTKRMCDFSRLLRINSSEWIIDNT